jgi:cell division septum initiation protein DivIVA
MDEYALAQAQLSGLFIEAALKEYAADWREGSENKTVTRDSATGQFAKKATSITESVKDAAATIQEALKDPKEAKRKVNSELLKLTAKGLDKLVEKNPEFADELLDRMFGVDAQTARDKLADKYGEINPGLPNAIRPEPLEDAVTGMGALLRMKAKLRHPKQIASGLKKAFEVAGYQYNKLIDALNNIESESEGIKLLGKIAATSIPIATYLAATLTPEIAIGMLVGDTLATILASAAVTQAASFAANKAMDKMDVKNPVLRLGIDLAIAIGVGSGFSVAPKKIRSLKLSNTNVAKIAQAGKTADDLKSTAKAVTQEVEKMKNPAKSLLEQQRRDRFLHSLSLTAEKTTDKVSKGFFANLSDYCALKLKPTEDLTSYVEKELRGMRTLLKDTDIDVEALTSRLAQMSDLSNVPLLQHQHRIKDVKKLVQRVKEIPQAAKNASSNKGSVLKQQASDLFKETAKRQNEGLPFEEAMSIKRNNYTLLDKAHALEQGDRVRTMLLNAEIKYGKQLDDFLGSVTSNTKTINKRYEAFLGSLVRDKPKNVAISKATDEDFIDYFNAVKLTGEWRRPWASKANRDKVVSESQKVIELFSRFSPVDLNIKIGSYGSRAYVAGTGSQLVNLADGNTRTVWHELTHMVEESIKGGFELSSAFRGIRTIQSGLDDLARLGMPGEKVIFDSFINPYAGKVYPSNSSEILTMAGENLASAESLHRFATLDREHLMFYLSVIDRG